MSLEDEVTRIGKQLEKIVSQEKDVSFPIPWNQRSTMCVYDQQISAKLTDLHLASHSKTQLLQNKTLFYVIRK